MAYRERHRQVLITTDRRSQITTDRSQQSNASTLFPDTHAARLSYNAAPQATSGSEYGTFSESALDQSAPSGPNLLSRRPHNPPNTSYYTDKPAPDIRRPQQLPSDPLTSLHGLPTDILYLILDEMPDQPTLYAFLKAFPSLKPIWRRNYSEIHRRIYEKAGLSEKMEKKTSSDGTK
ncbi:MAG: hypothetical protein LQ339_007735 [Xanthoria mediterranea]|nr:MAG: hypothetical protein LQ339_007735 [Xanthoria mediterranea]